MDLKNIANQTIDECESTNDLARKLAEAGYLSGSWVSAKRQSKGRGRQGNAWVSEEGNLHLSILLEPRNNKVVTLVPLFLATCVLDLMKIKHPNVPLKIKWPNDLVTCENKTLYKMGGILCEKIKTTQKKQFIIAGIGINFLRLPAEKLETLPITVSHFVSQDQIDLEEFKLELVELIRLRFDTSEMHLFRNELDQFNVHSAFNREELISWQESGVTKMGKFIGLNENGALKVDYNGKELLLYANEIQKVKAL